MKKMRSQVNLKGQVVEGIIQASKKRMQKFFEEDYAENMVKKLKQYIIGNKTDSVQTKVGF